MLSIFHLYATSGCYCMIVVGIAVLEVSARMFEYLPGTRMGIETGTHYQCIHYSGCFALMYGMVVMSIFVVCF